MIIVRDRAVLDEALGAFRSAGQSIGFVGTSGALHAGHLSLLRQASAENHVAIMFWTGEMAFPWAAGSNPAYLRDVERDAALARGAGAGLLYIPRGEEIFPEPPMAQVSAPGMHRPGLTEPRHLDMVALFMSKFLNMIGGCTCYMGEKDWQQLQMMGRIASDLSLPVSRFVGSPTVRDADGVPLSSRNVKLTVAQRQAAAVVPRALQAAADAIIAGERDGARVRSIIVDAIEAVAPLVYAEVLSENLQDLHLLRGPIRLMAAARFGDVEILDSVGVDAGMFG
ncbi:MAG: pantoate--beta-alanine ligase [Pseudomonadota bacterium]